MYVYWYDMRPKSWSAQLWFYKIGYEMDIFNIENLNLSQNILSSKYTLFAVVRYQTLIVLPYLTNGPATIEGLTLSTPSFFFSLKLCTLFRKNDSNNCLKKSFLLTMHFLIGLNIILRNCKPQLHIDFKN